MSGFDLAGLQAVVAAQSVVARVVIAGFQGSSPRETGAAMLVWEGGQSGTIGGGALEFAMAAEARRMLGTPGARRFVGLALGPALGQCCGGTVDCLIEVFDAATLPVAEGAVIARAMGHDGPRPPKVSRAVTMGGDRAQAIDGWFVEPIAEAPAPVWVYGAGHVGRALVHVLQDLPFSVTWIDTDRARFPETIPGHADMLVAVDPGAVVRHAPDDTHHLVMTYSHALDLEVCHQVLSRRFASLGLIGSATKRARFEARLRDLGHGAALRRLECPIGARELGKTPSAIALGTAVALLNRTKKAGNRQDEGYVA